MGDRAHRNALRGHRVALPLTTLFVAWAIRNIEALAGFLITEFYKASFLIITTLYAAVATVFSRFISVGFSTVEHTLKGTSNRITIAEFLFRDPHCAFLGIHAVVAFKGVSESLGVNHLYTLFLGDALQSGSPIIRVLPAIH